MADSRKTAALRQAAEALNRRLGSGVRPMVTEGPAAVLPTGFLGLDHALGLGGIPRGRIT